MLLSFNSIHACFIFTLVLLFSIIPTLTPCTHAHETIKYSLQQICSSACRYKDFVGVGSYTQEKGLYSCKNQDEYLCQICGTSFDLKLKKNCDLANFTVYYIL